MSHVDKLKELLKSDGSLRTKEPTGVEKLIDVMLLRQKEMNTRRPSRETMAYYFWDPSRSADKARAALYDALPELLECWLAVQEKKA